MSIKFWAAGAALAVGLAGAAAANAYTVIGQEDVTGGFVGNFLEGAFPGTHYIAASDGESPFDPFGAGYDTSDGLDLSGVGYSWSQAADSSWNFLGNQTWVLPADLTPFGCGVENGTTCEPVGHFISPDAWVDAALGTYVILEADGSVSDVIQAYNDINGANIKFYSDPSLPVPEPSTWAIMMMGLFGMGAALRARKVALAA